MCRSPPNEGSSTFCRVRLAGKPTMMRLMAGLDAPSSGRILADGNYVAGTSVREPSVAMMYHQFMNSPSLTVFEKIASPPRVAKDDGTENAGEAGGRAACRWAMASEDGGHA